MVELLVLFTHLLGVCVALGMIVLTDLRLLARAIGYRVVIPPPSRFERRIVSAALLWLYASGGVLVAMRLQASPDYLANPKFQAKLLLVMLLSANALVLHKRIFPVLERAQRVSDWPGATRWQVAFSVGLSNSLWLYCAFLGIARPWNNTLPLGVVLAVALGVWLFFVFAVRFTLALAGREAPDGRRDWLDSIKSSLSSFGDSWLDVDAASPLRAIEPGAGAALPAAANEPEAAPAAGARRA